MTSLLSRIDRPQDLHELSEDELQAVAQEVRELLIDTVGEIGGHFGANLGTCEIAVAIHSLLESPRDKVLWDVGHQAYPHKILTGRRDELGTIRKYGGLAPFCAIHESEHDIMGAGHASTSIGYGVGIKEAMRLAATRGEAGDERSEAGLRRLHELKTGRLIGASVECVLLLTGVRDPSPTLSEFRAFAAELGVLFQIVDDILDVTGTADALGKPQGSDERHGKLTYVTRYGLDGARAMAAESHRGARAALARATGGAGAAELEQITDFIANRTS